MKRKETVIIFQDLQKKKKPFGESLEYVTFCRNETQWFLITVAAITLSLIVQILNYVDFLKES